MITSELYKGKCYGVLGKGKAGQAAIDALKASDAEVYAWDDKNPAEPDIPYAEWPWNRMHAVVLSPGIPYTHPEPHPIVAMAAGHEVEIIGDVELLYRARSNAKYIGITGTNGKSTTTALIGHMLEMAGYDVQVGGNLGTPAMGLRDAYVYVLEMSSYQLDLVRNTRFDIAIMLNLSPDHLDRHGDMLGYMRAKQHIFDRQTHKDLAIIGGDDEWGHKMAAGIGARVQYISSRDRIRHEIEDAKNLQGDHNLQNAAAAYAVCRELSIDTETAAKLMHNFPGLAHRMEHVRDMGKVSYINDSKATNADASAKSLSTYQNIHWLAGGVAKEGGIESLLPLMPHVAHSYLYGEAANAFADTLKDHPHTVFETMDEAFAAAHKNAHAAEDGVVLLAPACASFDQFSSFEERGSHFKDLVLRAT